MKQHWKKLSEIVSCFGGARIAVLGDLVLDQYWFGVSQRLSREAPVPIVKIMGTELLPGCAANTIWNLASLGSVPIPIGILGSDNSGDQLCKLLYGRGIACTGIVRAAWETPTKTRILSGTTHGPKQQIARIDSGENNIISNSLVQDLRNKVSRVIDSGIDAIIISDYGYGMAEAVYDEELISGVGISAIDSRFSLDTFSGVTTATPNEEEFEKAVGRTIRHNAELELEGSKLRAAMGLKALLVTRGAQGMTLFEENNLLHLPVVGPPQAVDVTGAGDTVITTYVTALCLGASFAEAAAIANVAGGIVVQKHGPATTTPAEIIAALQEWGTN